MNLENMAYEICPIDGRYQDIKELVAPYFSEYAYIKYRVLVEVKWLVYLIEEGVIEIKVSSKDINKILKIINNFNLESYKEVKEEEKITNHDVKTIEYFIDKKLKELKLERLISFVHIGLTSEDINNIAYALMIKDYLNDVNFLKIEELIDYLKDLSIKYKEVVMLGHTHGQVATPTSVGKEFKVYWYRLKEELERLKSIKIKAKLNGATGNYSAISIAYNKLDVIELSRKFIESFDLTFNPLTTQIENHDYIVNILDNLRHINNIILDLDIDMWLYISKNYFKLEVINKEVGSSTMPHKVNPINFENSEANLELANSLLVELSNKLPRSRMQRDLSDSSSLRNLGMAFSYSQQGIKETLKGLKKINVNQEVINKDLDNNYEVLAEAIQTMLRKYKIRDAYQKLKDLTRGKVITKEMLTEFIKNLDIKKEDKEILLNLTPRTYIGKSKEI